MSLLAFISTGWLVFVALLVLIGLGNLILGSQKYAGRLYRKIAGATGMSYDPEAKELHALGCEGLPVLTLLKARRNLLHGTVAGVETVFVEVGKEGQVEDPLVPDVFSPLFCFRLPGRSLPAFRLFNHDGKGEAVLKDLPGEGSHPRHVVELRDNPGFPNFFLLLAQRKEDEGALRDLFPRPVQDFFVENRHWLRRVEGAGEWVGLPMTSFADVSWNAAKTFQEEIELTRRVHDVFARATG